MELSDLEPKEVSLNLEGVEVVFRPFTLADDLRIQKKYGGPKGLKKIFDDFDFEKISRIAWSQIKLDSQKEIVEAVQASEIDPDTGEETAVVMSPLDKFRHLFLGLPAQVDLLTTLVKCKGVNIPEITDLKKATDQPPS